MPRSSVPGGCSGCCERVASNKIHRTAASHDVVNCPLSSTGTLMPMYVILVVVVLLVAGLLVLADRATQVVRRARKRREAAERLAAAAARGTDKQRARTAAAEASDALTTVMPAILVEDHE